MTDSLAKQPPAVLRVFENDAYFSEGCPAGWHPEILHGRRVFMPDGGLGAPQLRTITALVTYGRVKTRQWVKVLGKEFQIMPRHFRALALFFIHNGHVVREERDPDKHARNWAYIWIPLEDKVAAKDNAAKQRFLAEAEEAKKEAFKTPFKSKKRHRKINSSRAEFLSKRFLAKAAKCADPKRRKYFLFVAYKMQQLKAQLILEEKGLDNEAAKNRPAASGVTETP